MIDVYIYAALSLGTFVLSYIVFSIFVGGCKLVFAKKEDDKKKPKR